MPIQLPDLDNRTFTDLMDEMVATIPKYTREWTNFNPSDPGMAILELLAWIGETLMYRANTVSLEAYENFLKLVAGDTVFDHSDKGHEAILAYLEKLGRGEAQPDLNEMKRQAASFLNSRYRAVTEEDFRQLAQEALPGEEALRIHVVVGPYAMGIVLIPAEVPEPQRSAELCQAVSGYLAPRRLLGTVVNVCTAGYARISLKVEVISHSYARKDTVQGAVEKAVRQYLAPFGGGPGGKGWPYGRDVVVYELCNVIEKVPGVKMVKQITSPGASFPLQIDGVIDQLGSTIEVGVTGEHEGGL